MDDMNPRAEIKNAKYVLTITDNQNDKEFSMVMNDVSELRRKGVAGKTVLNRFLDAVQAEIDGEKETSSNEQNTTN